MNERECVHATTMQIAGQTRLSKNDIAFYWVSAVNQLCVTSFLS